jgi:hypothetical protein
MKTLTVLAAVLLAALLCVWGYDASAAMLSTATGTLASTQAADGASANSVRVDGADTLYVEYDVVSGTASIKLQQKLLNGSNYTDVAGSTQTADSVLKIDNPAGEFQSVVSSCSADPVCSVTVKYQAVYTAIEKKQHR